jgi:hypothetical protein
LNKPNPEEIIFEPEGLKTILTWDQQRQMLDEIKVSANSLAESCRGLREIKATVAAFYVSQSLLLEFGTTFNANEAVKWLMKASDNDSHEDTDYLTQAWLWRISRALDVTIDIAPEKLRTLLTLSVMRDHWTCGEDILELAKNSTGSVQQQWQNDYCNFRNILVLQLGAVGMGYFYPRQMIPPWNSVNMGELNDLDRNIAAILGESYDSCPRLPNRPLPGPSTQRSYGRGKTAFDRIYINVRGHGPLHYAAASGYIDALRHMIATYDCDIDLPNQHVDETPLVCACSGGKVDCALLLLHNGADPNGYRFGQEGPLHWLSSFLPEEMESIASALVTVGADIELRSGGMRAEVRGIAAHWEPLFETRTTPLGRAVLGNNLMAVKVLLKLGADPLRKNANAHPDGFKGLDDTATKIDIVSPFEIAAALTLPKILAEFIKHIDGPSGAPRQRLLNVSSVVDLARGKRIAKFDPLTVQSRLVRHGSKWKSNLLATWRILHIRALPFEGKTPTEGIQEERSKTLCSEVAFGNVDIVECLLQLGYSASGT